MNADYRIFDFEDDDVDGTEWMEWEWTARRGGGMGRSFVGVAESKPQDFGEPG